MVYLMNIFGKIVTLSVVSLFIASCSNETPVSIGNGKNNDFNITAAMPFTPQGIISAEKNGFGRVIILAKSTANQVWVRAQDGKNGNWTSAWSRIGTNSNFVGNIVVKNGGQFVYACALGNNNSNGKKEMYVSTWSCENDNQPNFGPWGPLASYFGQTLKGEITALKGIDPCIYGIDLSGRITEFDIYGGVGDMYENYVGRGISGTKIAAIESPGNYPRNVFALNASNQLIWFRGTSSGAGGAGNWPNQDGQNLGGNISPTSDIAVEKNNDGRLEVFVAGPDYKMYHNWQLSAGGTSWSGWYTLGSNGLGPWDKIAVSHNYDGRLELIYKQNSQCMCLQHLWQLTGFTSWSDFYPFPQGEIVSMPTTANIATALYDNNYIAAFAYGYPGTPDLNICYTVQDPNSPGGWKRWTPLN